MKIDDNEDVKHNVKTEDAVADEAMTDAGILPNITGTAHWLQFRAAR